MTTQSILEIVTVIISEDSELADMVYARNDISIAPGENEVPLPLTLAPFCEDLAYPSINGGQKPCVKLIVSISLKDK